MPTTKTRLTGPMSKRLKAARVDAGLSVRDLALITGIAKRTISYYEDPLYQRARKAPYVRAWADACGVSFEELWGTSDKEISRRGCNACARPTHATRQYNHAA